MEDDSPSDLVVVNFYGITAISGKIDIFVNSMISTSMKKKTLFLRLILWTL